MGRTDVGFELGGARLAAWHYRAAGAGRRPCVVLAHGFAGTRPARLGAYAERFAAAGLDALVFDYRGFGDSGGAPRQVLDIAAQRADWRAAVAFARGLPDVDPDRVALWGTSFSGGHVLVVAAADPGIAAVVAQAPFVDGAATLARVPPATTARLTAAALRDVRAARSGAPPVTVPAVGPPGSVAFITTPDAEPGYRALFAPGEPWVNAVAARVALRIGLDRPIRAAPRVRCPLLVCVCDDDVVTPPEPAARAAGRAPRGELRRYHGGHFDIYVPPLFERAVADQTAFLTEHLLGARAAVAAPLAPAAV